ncbi:hypothetical protein [Haloplanus sp.]|uniref:hypothetical protein n=1 Tax=Haloplanus sp. TaxID=1961696 RepID=UPI002633AD8E|nr:hypothetical protein [Haloplanus sp.]
MTSTALRADDDSDVAGTDFSRLVDADSARTVHVGATAVSALVAEAARSTADTAPDATPRPADTQRYVEARLDG